MPVVPARISANGVVDDDMGRGVAGFSEYRAVLN